MGILTKSVVLLFVVVVIVIFVVVITTAEINVDAYHLLKCQQVVPILGASIEQTMLHRCTDLAILVLSYAQKIIDPCSVAESAIED